MIFLWHILISMVVYHQNAEDTLNLVPMTRWPRRRCSELTAFLSILMLASAAIWPLNGVFRNNRYFVLFIAPRLANFHHFFIFQVHYFFSHLSSFPSAIVPKQIFTENFMDFFKIKNNSAMYPFQYYNFSLIL